MAEPAKTAPDLLEPAQHAMNPASVTWPMWPEEVLASMKTCRRERPVVILNRDWKGTR